MHDQYDSRNKPRRNGREMGTWRLTSIRVVNRTPVLGAVAPVFEGVDVGDMGLRGQALEVHVIVVLAVGAECGVLVGRVGFTAQQEGERHKDSGLYWDSGDEQCSRESAGAKGESRGFYGGLWGATGRMERCWEVVGGAKRGKKMASMMKVIVGSEGSRCHHDERPRPQGPQGKSHGACT
jgi:hypothetical protein